MGFVMSISEETAELIDKLNDTYRECVEEPSILFLGAREYALFTGWKAGALKYAKEKRLTLSSPLIGLEVIAVDKDSYILLVAED